MEETFGRYKLLEPLGRGGMAEVFKAKSFGVEGFEKILVIKRILPHLASNRAFVDMFVREAKLAVRLSHANIVQVFDLGRVTEIGQPPSYYIAMEYVAGLDVASLLKRARRCSEILPIGLCLYIVAEIAKGLDHAHRRRDELMNPLGIVHRDVSPQNVMLSWEGEVKATDFGIAKARDMVEDSYASGQLKGKYAYMSPEQANGVPLDARSDIFSLGIIFYELVAGVNPFAAATPFETLRRVQAAEFPPLELLRDDVPIELSAIVQRALAKSPDDRFESAGRLFEDILGYMYSSGTRFTANGLTEYLATHRRDDASVHAANDAVQSLVPLSDEIDSTPVDVPSTSSGTRGADTASQTPQTHSGTTHIGERRDVTALVVTFSERDSTLPDSQHERVRDTLARYSARLIDEQPQQMVSLFGLGEADGRETETAVRCALVLLRLLSVGNVSPSAGVHAGSVVLNAGEPVRDVRLTSLVGEAQALARASEQRCAVSAVAAKEVRRVFFLEPLVDITHCGVASGAMLVEDLRAPDEALGRFVGRKHQFRRVGETLALATRRQLRVVTVLGEQGVGKTRFLYEVRRRLRKGDFNVGFYRASCPPRGRENVLLGLTSMLEVLCGVRDGDPLERVMEVEPRLRALGLHDEERHAVLGQLGAKRTGQAGATLPTLRVAFARMVHRLCEDRLHVFLWDNAHALDDETLEVLHAAAIRLSAARGVFMMAMRSPMPHELFRLTCCESIVLDELDESEIAKLVASRAGLREAPAELVAFCRARAGGHPLFVEELVRELVETGALVVKEGLVHSVKLTGDVAVPRSLRALLAARVTRLEPEYRAMLCATAILGEQVDITVLAAMLAVTLQASDRTIAALEKRSLLRRTGPSSVALASPMLRESLLESLPTETKLELHAAAVSAYETVYGASIENHAHHVAQHLREVGDRDRAAQFYALSGRQRLRSGQLEAAVRDMQYALDLVDVSRRSAEELCDWLEDIHTAVRAVRTGTALPNVIGRVLSRIDCDGNPGFCVQARTLAAGILGAIHQFDLADEYAKEAIELAENRAGMMAQRRAALIACAEIAFRRGKFGRSLAMFSEAAERVEDGEQSAKEAYRLAVGLAHTFAAQGDRNSALEQIERANDLADPTDTASAVEREKIAGIVHYFTADFRSAAYAFERGADIARTSGLSYEEALAEHNMGDAYVWLGDFVRAHVAFSESVAICDEYGYERLGAHNRMYLAFLEADKGRGDAAVVLRSLIAEAETNGFVWDELDGRHLLGMLAFRKGNRDSARKELRIVRDMAQENQNLLLHQSAVDMLAKLDPSEPNTH